MKLRSKWQLLRSFTKWVCTAVFAAVVAVWIASYWYYANAHWSYWNFVDIDRGGIIGGYECHSTPLPGEPFEIKRIQYPRYEPIGFGVSTAENALYIESPLWVIATLFALPAAFLWWRDVREPRRRRARNECPSCGYSLAGIAAGSGCPECGVKPAAR